MLEQKVVDYLMQNFGKSEEEARAAVAKHKGYVQQLHDKTVSDIGRQVASTEGWHMPPDAPDAVPSN